MQATLKMNEEELQKKREEAERKARRGEIDPTHEFTFHLIGQVCNTREAAKGKYNCTFCLSCLCAHLIYGKGIYFPQE